MAVPPMNMLAVMMISQCVQKRMVTTGNLYFLMNSQMISEKEEGKADSDRETEDDSTEQEDSLSQFNI